MGRRRYTNESRAEVMAALLAGQSIRAVATQYRNPEGTVASWESTLNGPLHNMHDAEKRSSVTSSWDTCASSWSLHAHS